MKLDLEGLIPATVLPMREDAEIDEAGLRRYIRHVASAKPKALAINVDTGEGPHLWQKERLRVLELVLAEAGDSIPVIPGPAAQFTAPAGELPPGTQNPVAAGPLCFP